MSPFVLEIPNHALERLKLRKVTRHLVRKAIVSGELVSVSEKGRSTRRIKIKGRTLEVVYLNRPGGFILVTCYWLGEYP